MNKMLIYICGAKFAATTLPKHRLLQKTNAKQSGIRPITTHKAP
jgi:hypothetical protein